MNKKESLLNEIKHHNKTLVTIEKYKNKTINCFWNLKKEEIIKRIEELFDDDLYSEKRKTKILRWKFEK